VASLSPNSCAATVITGLTIGRTGGRTAHDRTGVPTGPTAPVFADGVFADGEFADGVFADGVSADTATDDPGPTDAGSMDTGPADALSTAGFFARRSLRRIGMAQFPAPARVTRSAICVT
jgi:hypothetical protein